MIAIVVSLLKSLDTISMKLPLQVVWIGFHWEDTGYLCSEKPLMHHMLPMCPFSWAGALGSGGWGRGEGGIKIYFRSRKQMSLGPIIGHWISMRCVWSNFCLWNVTGESEGETEGSTFLSSINTSDLRANPTTGCRRPGSITAPETWSSREGQLHGAKSEGAF